MTRVTSSPVEVGLVLHLHRVVSSHFPRTVIPLSLERKWPMVVEFSETKPTIFEWAGMPDLSNLTDKYISVQPVAVSILPLLRMAQSVLVK